MKVCCVQVTDGQRCRQESSQERQKGIKGVGDEIGKWKEKKQNYENCIKNIVKVCIYSPEDM